MGDDRLRAALGGPELAWLIDRVRQRAERGLEASSGTVALRDPDRGQRAAVEALLGRPPGRGTTLRVDLAELDGLVRHAELAPGLRDAVERLGGPIVDRQALKAQRERDWARTLAEARERIRDHEPLQGWLEHVTQGGLLRRLSGGEPAEAARLLAAVLDVVERLPARALALAELAARVLGDSHALDAGAPVGTLAALAAARLGGVRLRGNANSRRDAWAAVGVLCDELSAPALVLNLRADRTSLTGRSLGLHSDAGEPVRLSLRQLLRHPPDFRRAATGRVFVCENPSVVAAAADRLGPDSAPLVCLEGQRKTAARVLLVALSSAGVELAYHGDFDWGGIRIGNVMVRDHSAHPWRFTATDYQATTGGTPLNGRPVLATWDPALTTALGRARRAVHEEQLLDVLLADLTQGTSSAAPD